MRVTQMRKTIAKRLVQSMQEAPHYYLTIDGDAGQLVASAPSSTSAAGHASRSAYNDLVMRAVRRRPGQATRTSTPAGRARPSASSAACTSASRWRCRPVSSRRSSATPSSSTCFERSRLPCASSPSARAPASSRGGVQRQLVLRVEPRHVRHQPLHGDHQPAGGLHPRGRRARRGAHREERRHQRRPSPDDDAVVRPSRRSTVPSAPRSCRSAQGPRERRRALLI